MKLSSSPLDFFAGLNSNCFRWPRSWEIGGCLKAQPCYWHYFQTTAFRIGCIMPRFPASIRLSADFKLLSFFTFKNCVSLLPKKTNKTELYYKYLGCKGTPYSITLGNISSA